MDKLRLGKIIGTHGIKGEIKIFPTTDFQMERFTPGNTIYLCQGNKELAYEIESHRIHKGNDLVKLVGFDNINDVERFKNYEVYGIKDDLDDEDGFFFEDLIGCEIINEDNKSCGKVIEIMEMPTQDLLKIEEGQRTYMIPYVDEFILDEDIDQKKIYVHFIKGLYNEN